MEPTTQEYPFAPPEVWSLILSSLRPQVLAQVAQVSSSFQSLSLPILYRAVHLCSDSEAVRSTFELLESAHSLRENIRDLKITGPWRNDDEQPDVWLNLDVLARLPSLRVLTIAGLPYHTARDNLAFITALSASCRFLDKLVLLEDPSADWEPDSNHEEWPVSHPLYFTEIFVQSRMSITRIAMVLLCGGENIMTSLPFSVPHFPNLTSLELGPCLDYPDDDGGLILTQFLIAHPLLEHLSLDFFAENTVSIELCEDIIKPDMLPRLRSLYASVGNVLRLARNGVRSLQTRLSKLHVKYDQSMMHEAGGMLSAFEEYGGLPMLSELCYELDVQQEWEEQKFCKRSMLRTGNMCPDLRRLTDSVLQMEAEDVVDVFSGFPKMTHLSFPLLKGTAETNIDIMSRLAPMCKELEEVLFGLDYGSYMQFSVQNGDVAKFSVVQGQLGF